MNINYGDFDHMSSVEVEYDTGGRQWFHMSDSTIDAFIESRHHSDTVSDIFHSSMCECRLSYSE